MCAKDATPPGFKGVDLFGKGGRDFPRHLSSLNHPLITKSETPVAQLARAYAGTGNFKLQLHKKLNHASLYPGGPLDKLCAQAFWQEIHQQSTLLV